MARMRRSQVGQGMVGRAPVWYGVAVCGKAR